MSFYLNLYENIKFAKVSALNLQLNLGTNYDLGSCSYLARTVSTSFDVPFFQVGLVRLFPASYLL